ncbi:MAG: 2-amino-4-hydroxy-6-hydroxymethyldihydropteridine diphosphokinase [Desulfocapsaceae bacterium]|nr:2-amino-4-hydroxy-6-hydroxymethyldihydropteridine diphosphokinase [Desulfocapsaceae bacterium]
MAHTAFIGLGSNLGDGNRILQDAWGRIGRMEGVRTLTLSHPYLTAPVEMDSGNLFTNAVGMLQTILSARALLECLLQVEAAFGRTRNASAAGYQDRPLDLDILYFDDLVLNTPELVLPHPRLDDRLFVLVPFAEISPDFRIPQEMYTISRRCALLREHLHGGSIPSQEIKKWEWEE